MPQSLELIIESLLYEEESATLDFKCEQYSFTGATNDVKSELLKDILAFANSWRRSNAYILVGVKEVKGKRCKINGISSDLDDAHIQQFVNSKTQHYIEFSYKTLSIEGKKIGVFIIPLQKRPFYLNKDYGKLKKETVYVRRGSSTAIANIDEIASMGADSLAHDDKEVEIEVQFASEDKSELIGTHIKITDINLKTPAVSDIPDYGVSEYPDFVSTHILIPSFDKNKDFYRECAEYLKTIASVSPLRIAINNSGNTVANDIKGIIEIDDPSNEVIVFDSSQLPDKPVSNKSALLHRNLPIGNNQDIIVKKYQSIWQITVRFPKIQAKDTVVSDSLLHIGAKLSRSIQLNTTLYCDELTDPIKKNLTVEVSVEERNIGLKELLEYLRK